MGTTVERNGEYLMYPYAEYPVYPFKGTRKQQSGTMGVLDHTRCTHLRVPDKTKVLLYLVRPPQEELTPAKWYSRYPRSVENTPCTHPVGTQRQNSGTLDILAKLSGEYSVYQSN